MKTITYNQSNDQGIFLVHLAVREDGTSDVTHVLVMPAQVGDTLVVMSLLELLLNSDVPFQQFLNDTLHVASDTSAIPTQPNYVTLLWVSTEGSTQITLTDTVETHN